VASQDALARLVSLVGQTAVEQAGLVIANKHQGNLADGWVQYYDATSAQHYYYHVHSKVTTWTKPAREPPQPPPRRLSRSSSAAPAHDAAVASPAADEADGAAAAAADAAVPSPADDSPEAAHAREGSRSRVRHGVAEAIAARATRQRMVEEVQFECSLAPDHGVAGLQSVSL
jgi:hypothetical protein